MLDISNKNYKSVIFPNSFFDTKKMVYHEYTREELKADINNFFIIVLCYDSIIKFIYCH